MAKETGFLKRSSVLKPFEFLAVLVFGHVGMKHPSLAGMVAAMKANISREALHQRFTASATQFLHRCLLLVMEQTMKLPSIDTKLLRPFRRVLIMDSSSWDVDEKLRGLLPGSGGSASKANCKLQAVYDYKQSTLSFLDVTPGTIPDNRYCSHLTEVLEKGDLLLIDQGYFKLDVLSDVLAMGAFFFTRFYIGTSLAWADSGDPIDLPRYLSGLQMNIADMKVIMARGKSNEVPCRLIALRVSPEIANQRRCKLRARAKKKGRTPSQQHLALCDWTLLITNIPQQHLPAKLSYALYALRWQIELLFKQFKSVLHIHHSQTANHYRLLCELYGRLIAATLILRIHALAHNTLWNEQRKEISFDKLHKRFQERAFALLQCLLSSPYCAFLYLQQQLSDFLPHCVKLPQASRPTSLHTIHSQLDSRLHFQPHHE